MKSKSTPTNNNHSDQPVIQVTLASFWKRLFAWIYDLLGALGVFVLAIVIGLIFVNLFALAFNIDSEQVAPALSNNPFWFLYIIACIQYYYVWCWVKGGQTVGMRTWRLKLCHPDGSYLSWKEAYIRSILSLGGVATVWSIFDSESRGGQDFLCNSRVIQLPKPAKKKKQLPII